MFCQRGGWGGGGGTTVQVFTVANSAYSELESESKSFIVQAHGYQEKMREKVD